jgi:ATP-dependent exoDNAse (exonuclease V) beta subunit
LNHIPEHFRKNIHPKDEKIQFMENDHSYFVDGEKIKFSVSEIIKIHFPEFDSNHWSRIKAIEELENRGELYTEFDVAFEQKILLNQWEIKRKDSSKKGLILHELIEKFYNNEEIELVPAEFIYFKEFISKYPKLKPYRTEWRVYNDELTLAGTIDMVYEKENGELFLFDWKRSTKIVNNAGLLIQSDFKYGFDQLSHVADNSFNKYALQQNLYKHILEEYYGKKISSMNLLVLHPNYHTFFHVPIPEMKKETDFLINQSIEKSR